MTNLILKAVLKLLFYFFIFFIVFEYLVNAQNFDQHKFPNDYRGIIHVHSELSHDSKGKFENIINAAKNNKIDFVVMTDHWSPLLYEKSKKGIYGNTLFIAGAEISKNEGITMIALPLPKNFVPENHWRKNIIALHKKGSLALANHIEFSETGYLGNFDGIEITNLHALILERSKTSLIFTYFRAIMPCNWNLKFIFGNIPNIERWRYLNQSEPLPAFAGNDTHDNYRLFYKIGPKLGSYNNTFKLITTHVWANELSEESVIESIKKGQSYFAFEVFGSAKGFKFYALNNKIVFMPGTIAPLESLIVLQAPPHKNPEKTKLKILHDGKIIKEGNGILLTFEAKKPGNYYGEIWKNNKPWIFSNPLVIKN